MRRIKSLVADLLDDLRIPGPPVPVDRIASAFGIDIVYRHFEDELSGFLFRQGDQAVIAVNTLHKPQRQRFTVAHELGHYFLNPGEGVFVDQGVLRFRASAASEGTDLDEVQANRFAAELLMPEDFIRHDVDPRPWILDDEDAIRDLAARYNVSLQALVIRLTRLGYPIMSE